MNSLGMRHPGDEQLLRFADGELSAMQAEEIRTHLRACWQCRTELEEIERTIGECVRYRKIVFEDGAPPPAPWFDIYPHLAGIDESHKRRHLARRAPDSLRAAFRSPRRWLPATVIPLLIAVVVHEFRQMPSVRAAELLHKAMMAADSRTPKPRRIQIRTRTQRVTRVVGSAQTFARDAAGKDPLVGLESLFRAAHYSWEDPLSAKSYSEWRDQLPQKRDEIISEQDRYRLRTTTDSGELAEATLRLNSPDLRAVEGTFQFRNHEWVEMSELPDAPDAASEVTEAVPPSPALSSNTGRRPELPATAVSPGEELQVLAALHRLGADLGDPIDVARSGGRILVTGMGIAPERQREIREELRAIPRVTVRFSAASAEAPGIEGRDPSAISIGPGMGRWQTEMQKQLGGRAAFEQFADQVLDLTDQFMSRAHALRRLADRFPANRELQMTVQQREILKTLRREHAEALLRKVIDIEDRMQPALIALGATPGAAQAMIVSGSWQDNTEQLFTEARHAETMLIGILGSAVAGVQSEELPAQVAASLTRLRGRAGNYERLTTGR